LVEVVVVLVFEAGFYLESVVIGVRAVVSPGAVAPLVHTPPGERWGGRDAFALRGRRGLTVLVDVSVEAPA
jgi:hypothetical protein